MQNTNKNVDKFDYINTEELFHYKRYLKGLIKPTDWKGYLK